MSRWDVGLPPAIRSNYGSDHSIVGRAEETILYLTATHPLCLICGPGGMTGPTITLLDAASSQTLATVLTDGDLLSFTPVRRKPAKRGERWSGESDRILSPQRKDQAGQITKDTDISPGARSEMRLSRNMQGTGQMRFRKPPAVDTETNPATWMSAWAAAGMTSVSIRMRARPGTRGLKPLAELQGKQATGRGATD